jgi:hypothetical protein
MIDAETRVQNALTVLYQSSQVDGAHHKAWVIDQILRTLTGCPTVEKTSINGKYTYECLGESDEYKQFIKDYEDGEDGPETYSWDVGIPA